jgi:hypothetical protein
VLLTRARNEGEILEEKDMRRRRLGFEGMREQHRRGRTGKGKKK